MTILSGKPKIHQIVILTQNLPSNFHTEESIPPPCLRTIFKLNTASLSLSFGTSQSQITKYQQHILECSVLVKLNKGYEELPKYEKIFDGTVDDQMKIAKIFKQHMWLKGNLKKD